MCADAAAIEPPEAMLFPLQEETAEHWCRIANEKLAAVDNAAYITLNDAKRVAKEGMGYFIHKDGKLLGIGQVGENSIELVASVSPGGGAHVVRALAQLLSGNISLQVASTNLKAVKLYENHGFTAAKRISSWYKIL